MTLFWHGHFTTGVEKVRLTYFIWQQNQMFRANALENFRSLTKEVSRDTAMMRYLDLIESKKGVPNENFARELMELFMLGEGVCYTEDDVRDAARAFTGYRVDPSRGTFALLKRQFDSHNKTFMNRTGPFDGDDVIDIILEQPECASFITKKIWSFFASENPFPAIIQSLAMAFRTSHFDIRNLLREIFLSEAFYDPKVIRSQIKSPVQWIVQTVRVLESPLPPAPIVDAALKQLGQVLFAPPNVKGWEGGRAWINSSTLLFRYNLAGYLANGKSSALGPVNVK